MELTRGFGIPISNNLPVGYEAAFSQEVTWQCLVGSVDEEEGGCEVEHRVPPARLDTTCFPTA